VRVLGPQYEGAVACFRPLVWSCVFMYTNIVLFSLLYALNNHRIPLIAILSALALEVAADFVFVPTHGIVAAAWARLAAEMVNAGILAIGLVRYRVVSASALVPGFFGRERARAS
jgi:Na+-driven multidrug efflux pump